MNKLDLLKYDPHVGKQLITFSEGVWDDALAGVKVKASHWLVASNRPGEYGAIGGGMKNLECFIGLVGSLQQAGGIWCHRWWNEKPGMFYWMVI